MLLNNKRNVFTKTKTYHWIQKVPHPVHSYFRPCQDHVIPVPNQLHTAVVEVRRPFYIILRRVTMTCPNDDRSAITTVVGDCSKIKTVNQSMLLALKEQNKKCESTIQIQRTIQI